jgi:hypothetical protein
MAILTSRSRSTVFAATGRSSVSVVMAAPFLSLRIEILARWSFQRAGAPAETQHRSGMRSSSRTLRKLAD